MNLTHVFYLQEIQYNLNQFQKRSLKNYQMSNYFFEVLRPGINTTFQDKGRFHMQHLGVAPGGCMDLESFSIVNALVGNTPDEGVLEFAYQ